MSLIGLPTLNAILNAISLIFLLLGYWRIKKQQINWHKKMMLTALAFSALFLTFYLIYHVHAGSTPYPHHNWTRSLYFSLLLPHIVLAALMTPLILVLVFRAWRQQFERHKRLARWVWPMWVYVSISGVLVYYLFYCY